MRLHRLRVQAFGPFAGTEEVDLDALSAHGLFLLHGPTGAGKTSVLDAICFALYGRVPGARSAGGVRLRSDHADAALAPEVLCEVSVSDRRFEVTRSPAWERPKKRGTGTTTEPARTLLRELVDGAWVARSSRNDEASQLLTDVLGMGLEQFTKVVLLPQGDFSAFLRADAESRRLILQRLFGTDRFATVESWLSEERRRLSRLVEDADARLDRLAARAHQAAAAVPPTGQTAAEPAQDPAQEPAQEPADEPGDPAELVQHLAVRVAATRDALLTEHAASRDLRDRLTDEATRAAARAERAARLALARRGLADLLAEAERLAGSTLLRDAGRRAAGLRGHLTTLAQAQELVTELRTQLSRLDPSQDDGCREPVPATELQRELDSLREELARLETLAGVEAEAEQAETAAVAAAARAAATSRELDQLGDDAATRQQERARLTAALEDAAEGPGVERADQDADRAAAVLAAATEVASLRQRLESSTAGLRELVDAAQRARAGWLDLREHRLGGMAAELAASLVDGEPCPVCGGDQHPRPAPAGDAAVTAQDERDALTVAEAAQTRRTEQERVVAELREALAAQLAVAGDTDAGSARDALTEATVRLELARRQQARAERDRAHLGQLVETGERDARRREELVGRLATEQAGAAAERRRADDLSARLAVARGEDATIAARTRRLRLRADVVTAVLAGRAELERSTAHRDRLLAAAVSACTAAGFGSVDEAATALLTDDELAGLDRALQQHADRLAAARARVADLTTADQPSQDATAEHASAEHASTEDLTAEDAAQDLAAAQEARAEAAAREELLGRRLALAEQATTALADLTEHAAADAAVAAPLRDRHTLVASLSRAAEGTGGDNALRMRLSSFVLAARLEQVAAAATVRLDRMSGGRYALAHSDALRGAGRSGLGLQVVDAWTGRSRETASLSGGETFLASLALALGLADVVQAEAGGAAIETLFVDEGFGTLDEEALEEVMATLDALREGGRAVGLVSHVAELRQRIPSGLQVVRTPEGSHLRLTGGGSGAAGGSAA